MTLGAQRKELLQATVHPQDCALEFWASRVLAFIVDQASTRDPLVLAGVDRWPGEPRSRETLLGLTIRAPQPHGQRTAGHEWRVALERSAQSSSCMGRKLFLYTALPIAFPKRSPAT